MPLHPYNQNETEKKNKSEKYSTSHTSIKLFQKNSRTSSNIAYGSQPWPMVSSVNKNVNPQC